MIAVGSGSANPDEDEVFVNKWRKGREVLGDEAVLTTTLDVGVPTLTRKVTDESGETSIDTVVITVRDTTAPTLILPADTIRSTSNSEAGRSAAPTLMTTTATTTTAASASGITTVAEETERPY